MDALLQWDAVNRQIVINQPGLLLVDEFKKLMSPERNKSKDDKTGKHLDRLMRELTYIYLMINWQSPFSDYTEQDRHKQAMISSGLTEEEWQDLDFRAACRKFKEIQESALEWRLLQSARKVVNEFITYFNTVDPMEVDQVTGKPIYKVKDIMVEVNNLSGVLESLKLLEYQFKKQAEAPRNNRGGVEEGFDPRKVKQDA